QGQFESFLGEREKVSPVEREGEVALADGTLRLRFDGIAPKGLRVSPYLHLIPRQRSQGEEPCRRDGSPGAGDRGADQSRRGGVAQLAKRRTNEQREPQARQVAVAVVGELVSGVNDTDHRRENDAVVNPDRQSGRPSPGQEKNRQADED